MKLIKICAVFSTLVCGFVSATTFNTTENIGSYNLIIKNDLTATADIEGAVFVGGNIIKGATFGNNCTADCATGVDAVTVVGDIESSFNVLSEAENVVYGGNFGGTDTNGNSIFEQNQLVSASLGSNGEKVIATTGDENTKVIVEVTNGSIVNEDSSLLSAALSTLFDGAIEDSTNYAALSDSDLSNDIISVNQGVLDDSDRNKITFSPPSVIDGDAVVFDVTGDLLASGGTFNFDNFVGIDIPIIINVTGASENPDVVDELNITAKFSGNRDAVSTSLLFNFNNYNQLTFNGDGFDGSVLAPQADVSVTSGAFDGSLVALSLNSTVELHAKLFNGEFGDGDTDQPNSSSGEPNDVPSPGVMLITIFALIYAMRRRKAIEPL